MRYKRLLSIVTVCTVICNSFLNFTISVNASETNDNVNNQQTNIITSGTDINELLKREYVDNVPLGYSEDIFSLYQPGWGFDKQDVYRTGIAAGFGMPVTIKANDIPVLVKDAQFTPSFVTSNYQLEETTEPEIIKTNISLNANSIYNGASAAEYPKVDASFSQELWGRALSQAYNGQTGGDGANWNTFRRPEDLNAFPVPDGGDWTSIEFAENVSVDEIRIHTFSDANIVHPEKITVYVWEADAWKETASSTDAPVGGWQTLLMPQEVSASKFKLVLEVEPGKALGADSIEYLQYSYDETGLEEIHINHAAGASRTGYPKASASFSQEKWGASLEYAFDGDSTASGNKGWNTYRQADDEMNNPKPEEGDWVSLEFDEAKTAQSLVLHIFSDGGNTIPPADVKLMYQSGGEWLEADYQQKPDTFSSGKNTITFSEIKSDKFKVVFKAQNGKCISMNEIELINSFMSKPQKVSVAGQKYISPDNKLVSILKVQNDDEAEMTIEVTAGIPLNFAEEGSKATGTLAGFEAVIQGDEGFVIQGDKLKKQVKLQPGESTECRVVLALSAEKAQSEEKILQLLTDPDPAATQKAAFIKWFEENIPYLDVPDEKLKQTYYFRWYTYRNHIRKTADDYYIISEFLPNVPWAGKDNSINCPAGLHVSEGRWLKDGKYLDDYLTHWMDKGGSVRAYSFWIADAFYNRYLTTGDEFIFNYVDKLKENYEAWGDKYNADLGLYWQHNDRDGMENSISSMFGYRPTINSYMYGDAAAISKLCELTGDLEGAQTYANKAAEIKSNFDKKTWDSEEKFYKVIASDQGGGLTSGSDLQSVKEQIGYIPWMFNMPDNNDEYSEAWKYLMDENYFLAPYGLLTAEKSRARVTPENEYGTGICRWDGPVWPFATSQTLTGMANLLNNYTQNQVTDNDYFHLLTNYAYAQYKNGASWIAEDLDGYTGQWIADEGRSPNYNHSLFNDLVISGLFGIRSAEDDNLTINPLIPTGEWSNFCLENVPYHGKNITMLYDETGDVYGQGAGFKVLVDGELKHSSKTPEKVSILLTETAVLEHIQLTPPSKTVYKIGEGFNSEGLKVVAHFTDGTQRELTSVEYETTGFSSDTAGTKIVTVICTVGEVTKSASFNVTVKAPEKEVLLDKIELVPPTKKEYRTGEGLDLTGLKVTAKYTDGTNKVLSSGTYQVTGFSSQTAGTKAVTVSYSERGVSKTASFNVSVKLTPNKQKLQIQYNSASKKKNTGYTSNSWSTFTKVRTYVKSILNNPNATQAQLDQALTDLKNAENRLTETVVKNKSYNYKGLKYKVTKVSGKKGTVIVTGAVSKKIRTIVIPGTVSLKGVKCTVEGISKKAFRGYSKLKKVTIGGNVRTIDAQAFENTPRLKSIIIKSTKLKTVKKNALKGIHKNAKINVPRKYKTSYKRIFKNKGQSSTVIIK